MILRNTLRLAVMSVVLLGVAAITSAKAEDTPLSLSGTTVVSADDVTKAQASGVMVIDVRVASEYADAHIKGAVSVPYREKSEKTLKYDPSVDEFNLAKLPADKATPVVIYCNGPECWKSYKASVVAVKAGYSHILWYRGGFPEWKAKSLPTE